MPTGEEIIDKSNGNPDEQLCGGGLLHKSEGGGEHVQGSSEDVYTEEKHRVTK